MKMKFLRKRAFSIKRKFAIKRKYFIKRKIPIKRSFSNYENNISNQNKFKLLLILPDKFFPWFLSKLQMDVYTYSMFNIDNKQYEKIIKETVKD